jgi:SAM-dependent methyltransferase
LDGGTHEYELLQCAGCSHIWLGSPPSPEELDGFYGAAYHRWVSQAGESSAGRWKKPFRVISKFKTSGSILDIGCSSGSFLSMFKGGSWKLYGIEASPLTGQKARAATGGEIFIGDALTANFPDETFDVITCIDVIEHLYEPRKVIAEVSRWLKPGGIFYVFVPNPVSWESRLFRSYWYGLDLPRHLQHFSPKSLGKLAASVGLRQLRLVTPSDSHLEYSLGLRLADWRVRNRGKSPLASAGKLSLPRRIFRKGFRLGVVSPWGMVTSLFKAGACVEGVFQKAVEPEPSREKSRK